jgi:hypothetical protein
MLHVTRNEGFQLQLENGWTVSVQFGPNHYSSNRNTGIKPMDQDITSASHAEVAAWKTESDNLPTRREWYNFGDSEHHNPIASMRNVSEVAGIIAHISALPRVGTEWMLGAAYIPLTTTS